ncbi:hypothetical protein [Burkholderia sp. D-99]|uniref:hypothetical protein n=1 Tax=Burkholderia sp. D-99 TaxID=2717316 RepID=UPI00141FCAA8|nr:hypothetical protein [Burkholderia sp. D-99]NHV27752.1 hypothetical protein [Burkholderia sp. D-99]
MRDPVTGAAIRIREDFTKEITRHRRIVGVEQVHRNTPPESGPLLRLYRRDVVHQLPDGLVLDRGRVLLHVRDVFDQRVSALAAVPKCSLKPAVGLRSLQGGQLRISIRALRFRLQVGRGLFCGRHCAVIRRHREPLCTVLARKPPRGIA